ncbi:CHAT domain-containing protein [Mycena rosella]|uniref:CHAT domain-containing protein n=1 Tax=Mycena rosella TaxID=1033263 RepID=A0AAD7CSJ9_MYCRO|nr:CHAT domain-containing protein [Mycena rosella]
MVESGSNTNWATAELDPQAVEGMDKALGEISGYAGDLNDLQAAIVNSQEAANHTPGDHPDRADRLESLAAAFNSRYQRLGDLIDLEAALRSLQEAADLTPADHPARARHLASLASSLDSRYQRLGDLKDLEAALQRAQEAASLMPEDHPDLHYIYKALQHYHPDLALHLQSLTALFDSRYRRLGDLKDLEAALQKAQEVADLTPADHPERARRLTSLAASLDSRYQMLGDLKDLQAALQMRQEVHHSSGDPQDSVAVHLNYAASLRHSVDPESSLNAALQWASFAKADDPSHIPAAYSAAFNLLPEILWVGHPTDVRHAAIRRLNIDTVTSSATRACIKLDHLKSAVEMLEQGIATTFQQMLQLKPNVDKLPSDQAEQLRQLSSALYSGTAANSMHLEIQRTCLLEEIRQQPGLKDFLLPKSYSALCQASQGGPIVILNSHHEGCDGIIILNPSSEPVQVAFPGVTSDLLKAQKAMLTGLLSHSNLTTGEHLVSSQIPALFTSKTTEEGFADLLKWLWTNVVDPVYQVLASYEIHDGRLWWLTTGAFNGLPVHASPPSDQFIHSYIPNLGCLLEAQSKKSRGQKIAVIGVARESFPERVNEEVQKICSVLRNYDFESLEAAQATKDAVKLALQDCSWVHFACHGIQDYITPTKSHLALYEENLDLATILQMQLSNAEFVFLPAGQTAMGDAKLVNESFHVAGGFIAAGFRSAVGTLWSTNSQDGPLIGEIFYTHLFGDGRQPQASDTARALQVVVKELKARNVPYEHWIPFVHMGV